MTSVVQGPLPQRLTDLRACDVMSRDVVTLGPLATVEQALAAMRDSGVRHLPIVLQGRFAGLVDDRTVALAHLVDGAPCGRRVFTLMTQDVPQVGPEADLPQVARLVETSACEAVVVMDEGGTLLGIVTASDLVHALGRQIAGTAVPLPPSVTSGPGLRQ